jgi:long-chain acyl-CoA synthetase
MVCSDQGDVDANRNWLITGRLKNLIILNSGHNIAPEPIEEEILERLPGGQQVVLVGNGRSYLSALAAGGVGPDEVQVSLDAVNAGLPHYKQVRGFRIILEPFTIENGLLTANGKLKRDGIAQRFSSQIEEIYKAVGFCYAQLFRERISWMCRPVPSKWRCTVILQ